MRYVIAASKIWKPGMIGELRKLSRGEFILLTKRKQLTAPRLKALRPRYIFFPHWSFFIPPEVYTEFECVIFHMTDVPFGRGGTPLQNLITRGIRKTKISAIRATGKIDAGDVYLKRNLSLKGTAQQIYERATRIILQMILEIIRNNPKPLPQKGKAVWFRRRIPAESNIQNLKTLKSVYDFIRMLDAEGYPHAFLESRHLRFEFTRAILKKNQVESKVTITLKRQIKL
ncbi:MAG: methionyl-tRNA formyltransferase [Candidatus Omnitrophica bacterium]|nr:methionyl-tRNA formyltransferase [Candidatus Omnitrophota bacterium]